MGLETGTGIGDLVPTNPLSTDAVSSGDDHIRLIKTVMQSITFLKSIQTFTASGTWTRPANVRKVIVYCLGGGGGGGGGATNGASGGGGSSAAVAIKWLDVTAIASVAVTIGAGGAGGAGGAAPAAGSVGLGTSFGAHCFAAPGQEGSSARVGGGPHTRAASTGDIIFTGGAGQSGTALQSPHSVGGIGGGSSGGAAESDAYANSGGGGGGGAASSAGSNPGGAGGSGYCIVFEFGW